MQAREPLTLPCGLVLANRVVKAAMAESMAEKARPGEKFVKSYGHWSDGGWGAVITGNVMVDRVHLGAPDDVAIIDGDAESTAQWQHWAQAAQQNVPTIVQINHPGRQSPMGAGQRSMFAKTIAPSAIPLNLGNNWVAYLARTLIFGTPRAMSSEDIEVVIEQFVRAAEIAANAGFTGVEIHAAHGYLLAQFLSPSSNTRTDSYGGSAKKRAEIVLQIIRRTRARVPADFCIGLKVNSVDFQHEAGIDEMLEQLELISNENIDFLELSGGSYEDPQMMSTTGSSLGMSERTIAREGFFLEASRAIRQRLPKTTLLVTGGFRSRAGVEHALGSGSCDLVGIGRPAVRHPHLPNRTLFNEKVDDLSARFDVEKAPDMGWIATKVRSISAGAESKYFGALISTLHQRF